MLPNGLDELGLDLGLRRLPNETLAHFRNRLIQEGREPAGASQEQYIRTTNRQAGILEQPIFEIDLVRDGDDIPLADDPFIEITSTWLRAYSDYESEVLDFELNLVDRSGGGYFLRDVEAAFTASTFFSLDVVPQDANYQFLRSNHLRYDSTDRVVLSEALFESRSNKLDNKLIKSLRADAAHLFKNEVATPSLIVSAGDFYIDYLNGVVFTEDIGAGFVSYTYRLFPYTMFWQAVNIYPANDKDIDYLHKHTLISDTTGLPEHLVLNSEGARITNNTLQVHPLGWGK
jgi:hypothetical protein